MFCLYYRLTGDEIMSNGKAISLGVRLEENRRQFLSQIGYCPQFDSIIGDMTGREMLRLFARLRGTLDTNLFLWSFEIYTLLIYKYMLYRYGS